MGKNVSAQMRVAHNRAASWYIQFLLKVADSSLSQNAKAAERGKEFFTSNDIAVINMGREKVERDAPKLVKILLSLRDDDAQQALLLLQGALSGAFEIGTRCAHKVRGEANSEIRRERKSRAKRDAEEALQAAIEAQRGDGPSDHPWKRADGILIPVNQRLESSGHKAVKVDVIKRRLQKFQRS